MRDLSTERELLSEQSLGLPHPHLHHHPRCPGQDHESEAPSPAKTCRTHGALFIGPSLSVKTSHAGLWMRDTI